MNKTPSTLDTLFASGLLFVCYGILWACGLWLFKLEVSPAALLGLPFLTLVVSCGNIPVVAEIIRSLKEVD